VMVLMDRDKTIVANYVKRGICGADLGAFNSVLFVSLCFLGLCDMKAEGRMRRR